MLAFWFTKVVDSSRELPKLRLFQILALRLTNGVRVPDSRGKGPHEVQSCDSDGC